MTKLTQLDLVQTKVTLDGVQKLKKALPKFAITWNGGTIGPKKKK